MERGETRANESRPRDQQEDLWDGGGRRRVFRNMGN